MKQPFTILIAFALSPLATLLAADPLSEETKRILAEAQSRIRAIYERREFRAAEFSAEWLPDRSGFTIQERDPETNKMIQVGYEVRAGQPLKKATLEDRPQARQPSVSPDGKWAIEFKDRNMLLRDISSGETTQMTHSVPEREVSFRGLAWSPDSTHLTFVESDSTDIRLRPVLVPEDPSYPGVRKNRFARVGEKIDALRVGLMDIVEKQTKWLPIETPAEGFYLGQLEWAGNSTEILVETMSRFRDKREFVLASIDGQIKNIYSETNAAWAESAQG